MFFVFLHLFVFLHFNVQNFGILAQKNWPSYGYFSIWPLFYVPEPLTSDATDSLLSV